MIPDSNPKNCFLKNMDVSVEIRNVALYTKDIPTIAIASTRKKLTQSKYRINLLLIKIMKILSSKFL